MPILVLVNNLVVFLATYLSSVSGFFMLAFGYLLVQHGASAHFRKEQRRDLRFHSYERSWYFFIAWVGAIVLSSVMFSLIFDEVYESENFLDYTTVALALYPVYQLMMLMWLLSHYAWFLPKWVSMTFIFLALAVAVINVTVIFLLPTHTTAHILNVFLLVPPVFGIFAVNSSITFRDIIREEVIIHEKKTKPKRSGFIVGFTDNNDYVYSN